MTAAAKAVSLRPSEAVAGGLIDDINAKITDAKFLMYDYNGKSERGASPALGLELELEDGTKHESYYSAGDAKYWAPSEDGKTLVPTGDKSSLTNSCKLVIFLTELVNAGFSEDKLASGDISVLIGLQAHFMRKADKERKGLVRKEDSREQSTLVVSKIIAMPGEKAPVAAAKPVAGQPTGVAQQAAPAAADVDGETIEVLQAVLAAEGGSIAKNKVSQAVFKLLTKDHAHFAKRTAITQRAFNDAFLKQGVDMGLWAFDGTTVKLG